MPSLRSPCRIKCSFVRSAVKRLADRAGAEGRGTAFGNKPHPPAGARERGGVARTDVRTGLPKVVSRVSDIQSPVVRFLGDARRIEEIHALVVGRTIVGVLVSPSGVLVQALKDVQRRLTVERSDWQGHVTVPKGGRSRQLPLTQRLTAALQGARHLNGERVLCLANGSGITRDRVIKAVRGAQGVAGIEEGVHILRHTFCSHLAMKGAPAPAIQELAGHADLSTTQRYMYLRPPATEDAIRLLDGSRFRRRARGELWRYFGHARGGGVNR